MAICIWPAFLVRGFCRYFLGYLGGATDNVANPRGCRGISLGAREHQMDSLELCRAQAWASHGFVHDGYQDWSSGGYSTGRLVDHASQLADHVLPGRGMRSCLADPLGFYGHRQERKPQSKPHQAKYGKDIVIPPAPRQSGDMGNSYRHLLVHVLRIFLPDMDAGLLYREEAPVTYPDGHVHIFQLWRNGCRGCTRGMGRGYCHRAWRRSGLSKEMVHHSRLCLRVHGTCWRPLRLHSYGIDLLDRLIVRPWPGNRQLLGFDPNISSGFGDRAGIWGAKLCSKRRWHSCTDFYRLAEATHGQLRRPHVCLLCLPRDRCDLIYLHGERAVCAAARVVSVLSPTPSHRLLLLSALRGDNHDHESSSFWFRSPLRSILGILKFRGR